MLGEAYTPDDEEDSAVAEITAVWAYQARYRIPLSKAIAGEPCCTADASQVSALRAYLFCHIVNLSLHHSAA